MGFVWAIRSDFAGSNRMGSCFSGVLLPICHAHAASTLCNFPGTVSAIISMAFFHGGLTVTFMGAKCSWYSLAFSFHYASFGPKSFITLCHA